MGLTDEEAYQKVGEPFDVIINIQGDEPFIHPEQIETIKRCFEDESVDIATLVKPFAAINTLDHRFASQQSQRLARKAGGCVTCRDNSYKFHFVYLL